MDFESLQSQGEVEQVDLQANNASSKAQIVVQHPTKAQRVLKGIGVGLLCLIATAFGALIPMLHFIIVPIMLVVTVFSVIKTVKPTKLILGGQGTCPACHKPFQILKRAYHFPFVDVCEACNRSVEVRSAL